MTNSFYLMQKDFVLLRKFLMLLVPVFFFMGFANRDTFSLFAAFPSMLLLISSCTMDTQQMNQRFLINLPVRRAELVRAKYMAILPYALFSLAITAITYLITNVVVGEVNPGFWKEVGMTIATFPILAVVYLPLHFWLGVKGAQIVNVVFMLIITLGASSASRLLQWIPTLKEWMNFGAEGNIIPYIVLGIAYVFVISCSYIISLRLFERKDI